MYIIVTILLLQLCHACKTDTYTLRRSTLLQKELALQVGSDIQLDQDEVIANEILMRLKQREIDDSFVNNRFNFTKHHFPYKNEIRNSDVYQIIRAMPKGGALHIHSTLMLSAEQLVALTHEDYLYACITDDNLKLQFSYHAPLRPCAHKWQLLDEVRKASANVTQFDMDLQRYFTLYTKNEEDMIYDIKAIWQRFEKVVKTISSLISYRPVREKFFYSGLKEFYDDNIMYIEFRSGLSFLYELNGTIHDRMYIARLYNSVAERFKMDYPDFIGVKMIVSQQRSTTMQQVSEVIGITKHLKHELPNFIAGFDLVGQEDPGKPLKYFHPLLEEVQNEVNFYFHTGETNWYGTTADENLIDAILLGSKRIGHGFSLIKHPTLLNAVRENDIAIEVNVISNLVLSLLCDVRNHPLASYLALGMPVVISSDDPGVWGADPLSHDYYIAFVAVASRHADLRMLKQLVINSVKYSSLGCNDKKNTFKQLNIKWEEFIRYVLKNYR